MKYKTYEELFDDGVKKGLLDPIELSLSNFEDKKRYCHPWLKNQFREKPLTIKNLEKALFQRNEKAFKVFFDSGVSKGIIKAGNTSVHRNSVLQGYRVFFDSWLKDNFGKEATHYKSYIKFLTFENLLLHEKWQTQRRTTDDLRDNLEYETSQKIVTKLGHPFFAYIKTEGIIDLEERFESIYDSEADKPKFLREIELLNNQRLAKTKAQLLTRPSAENEISRHEYLSDWIKRKQTTLKNTGAKGRKVNAKTYSTFESLFAEEGDAWTAVDALKRVEPPIINANGDYCLGSKSKGSMVAFANVLKHLNKIPKKIKDDHLARLLNQKFPELEISGRSLRALKTRFYEKYFKQLKLLLE